MKDGISPTPERDLLRRATEALAAYMGAMRVDTTDDRASIMAAIKKADALAQPVYAELYEFLESAPVGAAAPTPARLDEDAPKQTMAERFNVDPAWADEKTPKPQEGQWTLTAPDGRTWTAQSPLRVCAAESGERVPAHVALARIARGCDEPASSISGEAAAPLPVQPKPFAMLMFPKHMRPEVWLGVIDGDGTFAPLSGTGPLRAPEEWVAALRASSAPTTKG